MKKKIQSVIYKFLLKKVSKGKSLGEEESKEEDGRLLETEKQRKTVTSKENFKKNCEWFRENYKVTKNGKGFQRREKLGKRVKVFVELEGNLKTVEISEKLELNKKKGKNLRKDNRN